MELVRIEIINDLLTLGSVGLLVGVAFPIIFRMIGFFVDFVRTIVE